MTKKLSEAQIQTMLLRAQMIHSRVVEMEAERIREIGLENLRAREQSAFGPPHPFAAVLAVGIVIVSFLLALLSR